LGELTNLRTTIAVAAIGTVAVLVFALLPAISGVLAERFSLDDIQTGFAATSYFATYAVVTASSGLWIRRFRWTRLLAIGFAAMVSGLLSCAFAESFGWAQYSLAIVGAGAALLFPISFAIASDMQNTDRVFAIKLAAEQLVPAAMLLLLAGTIVIIGAYTDLFLGILLIVTIGSASILLVPDNVGEQENSSHSSTGGFFSGSFALVGLLVNFSGFAGLWAFLERIANENSLDAAFTGRWIALGLVTSGIGPLCVAFIGERLDRRLAIIVASTVAVFSLLLLRGEISEVRFAITLFVLPLSYYFAVSYMLAIVADADYNGKVSGLMSFVLAFGAISGPALFGYFKSIDGPVLGAMAALLVIGAGIMVVVQMTLHSSVGKIGSKK
jgi:predicted MFS family arabinose efflux permease